MTDTTAPDNFTEDLNLPVETIVKTYLKIRNTKEAASSAFKKKDAEYKAQLEQLETWLIARAERDGVTGFKTTYGTVYFKEDLQAQFANFDLAWKWAAENDLAELFQKRISSTFVKDYIEKHEGNLPPGVSVFRQKTAGIRSA